MYKHAQCVNLSSAFQICAQYHICRHLKARIKLPHVYYFEDILKSQEITEGYYTVKAVKQITDEKKIDMPIMQSVYNILYNSHSIKDEIKNLLERPITDEFKK